MKIRHDLHVNEGFTIVELLIVIVVIGILAAITITSYSGINQRAIDVAIRSELNNAIKVISMEYTSTGLVPTTFPADFKYANNVGLSLASTGNVNVFCINIQNLNNSNPIYMYYLSSDGVVSSGSCSGNVVPGSEKNLPSNLVPDASFATISGSGWNILLSNNSGYTLTARSGTSSDPIINKPVLNLSNNSSKAESWSVLFGKINYADVIMGNNYRLTVWCRRTGAGYSGNIGGMSIRDTNNLNPSVPGGGSLTPSDSWQKFSATGTATAAGFASNGFYLPMNTASFLNTGWSLEFQDPQVVRI
jgi:prepilin-type N-terminal cleavage/methylation domain-containing protein